jgi:hypothetical protein
MDTKLRPGIEIELDGTTYVVPPLTVGALRRLEPMFSALEPLSDGRTLPTPAQFDAIAAVVAEALKRNYPDVTPEALLERLDLVNVGPVFQAILKASGLAQNERKEAGAAPFGGATSTD